MAGRQGFPDICSSEAKCSQVPASTALRGTHTAQRAPVRGIWKPALVAIHRKASHFHVRQIWICFPTNQAVAVSLDESVKSIHLYNPGSSLLQLR